MKYKAILLDVDGTLLSNNNKLPSLRVTEAIAKAAKKIHVGVATARPLFMTTHILKHLNLSGFSILNGGAHIIDKEENTLVEKIISIKDLKNVCNILKKLKIPFLIHDNGKEIEYVKNYTPQKPLAIFTLEIPLEKAEQVVEKVSHISSIASHKIQWKEKHNYGVHITHSSATKQHGIMEIAKLLNIQTHEIIGVGDGYNDFPLLMACGLKVAMGNAVDDLKAIADYIAPSVDEDGVADVIEKFILK